MADECTATLARRVAPVQANPERPPDAPEAQEHVASGGWPGAALSSGMSGRPFGILLEIDGELRIVEGDELSALRGSEALLTEGVFGEGFDERPMIEAVREQMSERIEELLLEWHGAEITQRASSRTRDC